MIYLNNESSNYSYLYANQVMKYSKEMLVTRCSRKHMSHVKIYEFILNIDAFYHSIGSNILDVIVHIKMSHNSRALWKIVICYCIARNWDKVNCIAWNRFVEIKTEVFIHWDNCNPWDWIVYDQPFFASMVSMKALWTEPWYFHRVCIKMIGFQGHEGRQKFCYISLINYFWFIDVNWIVIFQHQFCDSFCRFQ